MKPYKQLFTIALATVALTLLPAQFAEAQDSKCITGLGASVAVDDDVIVAGAPGYNESDYYGAVKVFAKQTGKLLYTIPNPRGGERREELRGFGYRVAISGKRIVVWNGPYSPLAYVFNLAGADPLLPVATLSSQPRRDAFSDKVAISGPWVVLGGSKALNVYNLERAEADQPIAVLKSPKPKADDLFGDDFAMSGTRVVVGARWGNRAYVFELTGSKPQVPIAELGSPQPGTECYFGINVAISGSKVAVRSLPKDKHGQIVHIYEIGGGNPNLVATIERPDRGGGDITMAGSRVGMCTDINKSKHIFVYDLNGGDTTTPVLTFKMPPVRGGWLGDSMAMSGTCLVVGYPNEEAKDYITGNLYSFDLATGSLLTQLYPTKQGRSGGNSLSEIANQIPKSSWHVGERDAGRQARIDAAVARSRQLNEERQANDAAAVGAGAARGLDRATDIINPPPISR